MAGAATALPDAAMTPAVDRAAATTNRRAAVLRIKVFLGSGCHSGSPTEARHVPRGWLESHCSNRSRAVRDAVAAGSWQKAVRAWSGG